MVVFALVAHPLVEYPAFSLDSAFELAFYSIGVSCCFPVSTEVDYTLSHKWYKSPILRPFPSLSY